MATAAKLTGSRILGHLGALKKTPFRHGLTVHALHKSASMFLYHFFADLCSRRDIPFFSIHHQAAAEQRPASDIAQPFVFGPIRSFETGDLQFPNMDRITRLIQIRDPRDIIVSQYYSLGWIHSDAGWTDEEKARREHIRKVDINEFAVREAEYSRYPLIERYSQILKLIDEPDVVIVRYEDMVLDFPTWLGPVLQAAGIRRQVYWRRRLQRQYRNEFQPGSGGDSHKRNVTPGDHRRQLSPQTICELNRQFETILFRLGYNPGDSG